MFTKNNLRTGDFVLRANGVEEVFIKEAGVFIGIEGYMRFISLADDLTEPGDDEWDIVKVRRPIETHHYQFDCPNFGKVVYERERDTKKRYNGKVVCIDNTYNPHNYTVGKIYQFNDGVITDDDGFEFGNIEGEMFYTFEDWAKWTGSKFIEIVE